MELPQTVIKCDGCGEELNILNPYLYMTLKAQREVLVMEDVVPDDDPNAVPEPNMYLGVKSGRGVLRRFHGFTCMSKWVNDDKRKGKPAKIEYHAEKATVSK